MADRVGDAAVALSTNEEVLLMVTLRVKVQLTLCVASTVFDEELRAVKLIVMLRGRVRVADALPL
jgi:hypothetical protein